MDSKITAVFLPGKLCDQRLWQQSMDALSNLINPIFIDLRFQQTLDEMLDAVHAIAEETFILIGFSMGGHVAQEFALKYRERLLGLGLIGVSANEYSKEEKAQQKNFIDYARKHGFKGLSDIALRKFIHSNNYEKVAELVKDMARESGTRTFIYQHLATMDRRSRLKALEKIDCKTIVIAANDDQVVPSASVKEMALNIPNSEFHLLNDCGHMIPLEQTITLNEILKNWIKKF